MAKAKEVRQVFVDAGVEDIDTRMKFVQFRNIVRITVISKYARFGSYDENGYFVNLLRNKGFKVIKVSWRNMRRPRIIVLNKSWRDWYNDQTKGRLFINVE